MSNQREQLVNCLRRLVQDIENLPSFVEDDDLFYIYPPTVDFTVRAATTPNAARDTMAQIARSGGKWKKDYGWEFRLTRRYEDGDGNIRATLTFSTSREKVCERKVVGTKHHPEVTLPARDEEIVEWVCNDPLLKED